MNTITTPAPLRCPSEPPLDLLHAVAMTTDAPMAYLQWPSTRCVWATPAYSKLLALRAQDLVGKELQNYLTTCDCNEWMCELERLEATPLHGASLRTTLCFAQQQRLKTLLVAHVQDDQVQGFVVIAQHGLPYHEAIQMVQDSEIRMRRYAQATSEAIIFFQQDLIFDANPAAAALTGYPLNQLVERPVLHLLPHILRAQAQPWLTLGSDGPQEMRLLHHRGQEIDVEVTVNLLPKDGDYMGMMVLRDITARKRAESEMHFLAYHDPLTRLPNRQGLMQQLRQALQKAQQQQQQVAVLYVDLDRFKDVNDSLSHEAGDKVLIETARRLRSKVHPDDTVARLGADEFVVVLASPHTSSQPDCVLREIRFALTKPYALPNGLVNLPACIGVSLYPENGSAADELMLNASAALKIAKGLGQGHIQFYSTTLNVRPSRLLRQDRLLREAIENDQGLLLHYQPLWNLAANRLEGFEALVRWQHPERGMLPPGEFIAFAESRGLISMVDRWVMRAACKQLRAWCDAGLPPVVMAVNMSAIEFNQNNLVDEVRSILQDTQIEPQWLEIELTETTLMKQSEHVLCTLEALRNLGVRLALDDFGTGYSSLAYLKRYPLNKIKIDRSFVKDTPEDTDDVSLIKAMIQMAHSLDLHIVAEGVETQAQWSLMQDLGSDVIQGYYLSRPMPPEDAMHWQMQHRQMVMPH